MAAASLETDVVSTIGSTSASESRGPENADEGHIAGVELNFQTYFTRLPAPFDGLGVNVNYTCD